MQISFVVVVVLSVMACAAAVRTARGPAPLVEVSQIYEVVAQCFPQVGCYGEVLRIDAVRPDGWADVTQCGHDRQTGRAICGAGERWRVNLAQAYAIRSHGAGIAAN